jgi:Tfp pilus assembly protein PilX
VVSGSRRLRRLRRRSRQRGAALFLVVLVVTLLLGIGAFAARSAGLAAAASGSERQMTQARYVAEYGLTFAAAKLSTGAAQTYLQLMRNPVATELCFGQNTTMIQRSCYRVLESDVANDFTNASSSFSVCQPVASGAPGSLGMANAECDFVVELSDLSEGFTLPGYDLGHGKSLKFWYVTGTATGQVRIVNTAGPTALDATAAESSSTQTLRSHILVGPFPSN